MVEQRYIVKLWTHKGNRIEWAIVHKGAPRIPLRRAEHTSSLNPPQILIEEAAQMERENPRYTI